MGSYCIILVVIVLFTGVEGIIDLNCSVFDKVEIQDDFDESIAIEKCGSADEGERSNMELVQLEDGINVRVEDSRLMTHRMRKRLQLLSNLSIKKIPEHTISIVKAFDNSDSESLFSEGRSVVLRLSTRNETKVMEFSKLLKCCLFNDVQLRGRDMKFMVSVQKSTENLIFQPFPFTYMSSCTSSDPQYEIPEPEDDAKEEDADQEDEDEATEENEEEEGSSLQAELFDSEVYYNYPLTKNSLTMDSFIKPDLQECGCKKTRYFRISPVLAEAITKLENVFKQHDDYDPEEPVMEIIHGYMSDEVHRKMVDDAFLDTVEGQYYKSRDSLDNSLGRRDHRRGYGVLIRTPYDALDAMSILLKTLGPFVRSRGLYLGVALHNVTKHPCPYFNEHGLYFDIRNTEHAAWVTYDNYFVQGLRLTTEYFQEQTEEILSKLTRFVKPYSGAVSIVPPRPHDPDFEYIPPGKFDEQKESPCVLTVEQQEAFDIEPLQDEYDYEETVKFKCKNNRKLWLPLIDGVHAETICQYGELDDLIPELCYGDLLDDFDPDKKLFTKRRSFPKVGLPFTKSKKDIEHERWCNVTEVYRKDAAQKLWAIVNKRPTARNKFEVREELEQCFWHLCGNRRRGSTWKEKKKHCSNFLHWMPTAMSSEIEDGTIHQDENPNIIRLACGGNKNCVEKTDIHGIVTKLLDRKYNSSVDESIEFQLYSEHNNPLPLMDVIDEIFAMSLTGTVNVYINDHNDVTAMEDVLKAAMTYNHKIDDVVFCVLNKTSPESSKFEIEHFKIKNRIYNSVTRMVHGWSRLANPTFSRETIAPFSVDVVIFPPEDPEEIKDSETYVRTVKEKKEWEFKWLEKLQRL